MERDHAHRLCFRTSVNFLMEMCVCRPGWNWFCNCKNISASCNQAPSTTLICRKLHAGLKAAQLHNAITLELCGGQTNTSNGTSSESFAQVKVQWMKNVSKKSTYQRIPSPGSLTMPDNVPIDMSETLIGLRRRPKKTHHWVKCRSSSLSTCRIN